MARYTLAFFLVLISFMSFGQSMTITSPVLSEPYLVSSGTEVTFEWYYFDEAPTSFFYWDQEPTNMIDYQFSPNPEWTASTGYVNNGNGTYSLTITVNDPIWVWAGFSTFSGYTYSNVVNVGIASSVVIAPSAESICPGGDVSIAVVGTYDAYQWYLNNEIITDETSSSILVSEEGTYKLEVEDNGEFIFSNAVNLSFLSIEMTGQLSVDATTLELSGTAGFDSYQWYSGTDMEVMSAIDGATSVGYDAVLQDTLTYYYVEGTMNGCVVESSLNSASIEMFTMPTITLSADSNEFGNVCEGTTFVLTAPLGYPSYSWFSNGFQAWGDQNVFEVNSVWSQGVYHLEVGVENWPDISLSSNELDVYYFEVVQPQLFGVTNYEQFCPGEEVMITLSDEGYDYTWYKHASFGDTSPENEVVVDGSTYTFNFEDATYVSVVGEWQGCSNQTQLFLDSYENLFIYLQLANFDQEYLCLDSTAVLQLPEYQQSLFENVQWFEMIDGEGVAIDGETNFALNVTEPGEFYLTASVVDCPGAIITSNTKEIKDYTERELFIWATQETLCVGETADLNISGGFSWNSIQWFEQDIQIGDGGYEGVFVPIIGAGNGAVQTVDEFNRYLVKARHSSCPNGIKLESNIVEISPTLNPSIISSEEPSETSEIVNAYNTAEVLLYCSGVEMILSLDSEWDSVNWYESGYSGADDYELGDLIGSNDTLGYTTIGVDYITAEVEMDGCVGYSNPILIDIWAFQSPVIASYNNAELCAIGDTALLHVAFPGDWVYFEWLANGELIPNSNNDTLFATIPNTEYVVVAYPEVCPTQGYSSGQGPYVTVLDAAIGEDEDVIYAIPFAGFYDFQWYFNGEAIENPNTTTPWLLYKSEMEAGEYTVEISNGIPCTSLSEVYMFDPNSVSNINLNELNVYPNPATNQLFIDSDRKIETIEAYTAQGKLEKTWRGTSNELRVLDISEFEIGIHFFRVYYSEGLSQEIRIVKM